MDRFRVLTLASSEPGRGGMALRLLAVGLLLLVGVTSQAAGSKVPTAAIGSQGDADAAGPYIVNIGRSPLPQPGEQIKKPLPFKRLVPRVSLPVPQEPIPWNKASLHVGQEVTVIGKIVNTHNTGSVCFLNFQEDWRSHFYVVIYKEALGSWSQPPEDYFLNKKVKVTGKIYLRGTRPQIRVKDADQISIVK